MSRLRTLGILNREGMKAANAGRVADAMFQLAQAAQIAETMDSPLHMAKVRNNIGLVNQQAGKFDEAKACFLLAEQSAVEGAGEGNILQRAIVRNMAHLDQAQAGLGA
ncbi:tetratricopeptide repeat protein [Pseudodesulfovibrio sp. zrk46]|uniref:tetratricopeptide repeat protein n=1 Tax=Pseudodesulfovibrio sp. zrk46 TaxID=2725288 RepID=UPI0014498363|nr:tetratricopeptide repeat protein [Pseudodesulfovibrio sp. zrk46]QJB55512.1 tetratricopeptide repeat protein [Pseudodesulfovibrio sp. zrk46]